MPRATTRQRGKARPAVDRSLPRGGTVNGVERALEVLALFGESDSDTLGVTEIAETTGLSKAVVHRILSTCRAAGFVDMDERTHRYRLGQQVLLLGLSYLDRLDIRAMARDVMADLVAATDETATLSVRVGWSRVYIDQVTPNRDVKMVVQLGRAYPLHAGSSSKALLAFLPEAEREEYLATAHLTALTARTITDPDRLRQELAGIVERGFAVSFGERDASAGSMAAPVWGYNHDLLGVVSVCGPVERFSAEVSRLERTLLEHTRQLSQRLGYRE